MTLALVGSGGGTSPKFAMGGTVQDATAGGVVGNVLTRVTVPEAETVVVAGLLLSSLITCSVVAAAEPFFDRLMKPPAGVFKLKFTSLKFDGSPLEKSFFCAATVAEPTTTLILLASPATPAPMSTFRPVNWKGPGSATMLPKTEALTVAVPLLFWMKMPSSFVRRTSLLAIMMLCVPDEPEMASLKPLA